MSIFYEDGFVQLHHGEYADHLTDLIALDVAAIITDPPYGETALQWDRWPRDWPDHAYYVTNALWCFGSMRMFLDNKQDFSQWKFSHEIVWEKHNGSGFAADKFRRVHELATFWYHGEWGSVRHDTPRIPSPSGASKSVRRRGQTPHTGEVGDTGYTDDGTRMMPSVQFVRSEHGRAIHPTQKPVGIVAPLIEYSVPLGGLVVDFFAGSGTTAVAARQLGRKCIAFEAREDYAEAAAVRLSQQAFDFTTLEVS